MNAENVALLARNHRLQREAMREALKALRAIRTLVRAEATQTKDEDNTAFKVFALSDHALYKLDTVKEQTPTML